MKNIYTPDNIPLSKFEGDYEIFTGVAGSTHECGWLVEFFFLGSRTTRGEWIKKPTPGWEHKSRVKPSNGENEMNIRSAYRDELEHICSVLNAR